MPRYRFMEITLNVIGLFNILFIANGIGVIVLCMLQMGSSTHIQKDVRIYFQVFFAMILVYISAHLARECLNGLPGNAVRVSLYIITFVEMFAAGIMAHMMSLLVLASAKRGEPIKAMKPLLIVLYAFLLAHTVLLIVGWPLDLVYTFDANNVYHRGNLYLLSNLGPVLMLIVDVILLIRYRKNVDRRLRIALWIYMVAPLIALALQSFISGFQFLIYATVAAAVYLFSTISHSQSMEFQKQENEKSRIETELTMASSIQADMLPSVYPAFPERPEFDVFASMNPAKEVGGDFYDFFLIDDDHLCLVIADVSGKGVPAALFMMASKIILANNAMITKSPAATLKNANDAICANNREEMFVTVWIGILELSTGKLTAANAGHEYPAIYNPGGKFELFSDKHGFVVGGFAGMEYTEYEVMLKPGAKVFLYTDGVPEANNAKQKLFQTYRLLEALNKDPTKSPKELADQVKGSVDAFVQGAEQFDDLTMLCVEYFGPKAK